MNLVKPDAVERVAILGAGTIGASWAAYFLAHGLAVNIWDPAPGYEARCRAFIAAAWPALSRLGAPEAPDESRMAFFDDMAEAVRSSQFVQENGPEDKQLKIELYSRLDDAMADGVVMASSSSGLLISELQAGRKAAARYVIGHPFNPPHLIPLVEVVGGEQTDAAAIDWALAFYNGCGKKAIRINREVPGHLANRLQAAMWREAMHLVDTDVASVEDIDIAVSYGPGLRWALMGPNLIFHLAGGDGGIRHSVEHFGPALESWWADLGSAPTISSRTAEKLIAGVEDEAAGRSLEDLTGERDQLLISLLEMLARERGKS
ncbi:MAG: 3-hydroxyacyl-CoA dehydrogenase NAD-binding domain-containing protein [Alphaproteobacteria bacterium]|jgi:3-hydroxyacyl-CoA dehydrogenase|nr:3-hydroxyacyl-CoA dehydrogenase NAD-binding domain-containing protein [Alphaproteobacteria bacterium]MDP6590958.1 3-hydroxyacyl-CoA dehydrogenase NAD-binding domain-containing protein [Alphaproteobacteria bacterium]MDP6816872.1 3-hydroxyacyl-CoA dehydrogenase NAD-binding domain-containing protein [Alphaproteobacteria bacterium]